DDVVVEDRLDRNPFGHRPLRVQPRADEPLLFAGVAHEDERRLEVDAALTEDPGELDRQRRAAAIVVDARREIVDRRIRVRRWRSGCIWIAGCARRVGRTLTAGPRHGVVVAADVDPTRTPAWQDGHYVSQLDIARDPSLLRDLMRVEAYLQ